uniref:Uncharacterized protein n=1 Tax=Anguilla anguilla TaxID=7936 RepID=A0A0E9XG95_ANGAN
MLIRMALSDHTHYRAVETDIDE